MVGDAVVDVVAATVAVVVAAVPWGVGCPCEVLKALALLRQPDGAAVPRGVVCGAVVGAAVAAAVGAAVAAVPRGVVCPCEVLKALTLLPVGADEVVRALMCLPVCAGEVSLIAAEPRGVVWDDDRVA